MCNNVERVVPPSYLMRSVHINVYKSLLRRRVQENFALLHEIHEGLYDTNHLSADLHKSDLSLPLLVGYVHSVQCHAHSDWTALLVDEMHSVVGANGPAVCNRGVLCWLEERMIKEHAQWIRPGAVWLLEGAKLALFPTNVDGGEDEEQQIDTNDATNGQQSSDTNLANANSNIDRMILVGESSLVFAWTPEEASAAFTNDDLVPLNDRRNNIRMPGPECIAVDLEDETEDDRGTLSPGTASLALPEANDKTTMSSEGETISSPNRSEETVTELPDQQPCLSPPPPKLSDGQMQDHDARLESGIVKATASSESLNRRVTDDKSDVQASDEPSSGIVPVERDRKRDTPAENDIVCNPSATVSRPITHEKNTLKSKSTGQPDQPQQSAHCQVDLIDDGSKQAFEDQELTKRSDILSKNIQCKANNRETMNDQQGLGLGTSPVRCMTPVEAKRPLVGKPPSTGGSFDDMLDEDEDILFQKEKNDRGNSELDAHPPTKVGQTANTSIFDDVEDDFLDFLGDDD